MCWSTTSPANILERFNGRVTVYSGDLSKEHLDLSDEKYLYLTENTDCILHCAGLVKHFGAWSEFEKANVTVTEKIISLAKQGREKRLLFISTMGTAYTSDIFQSKLPFTEYDLPSGEIDDNFYLRSKTMAEQLVNAAAKDGLDAKIFRLEYLTQSEKTGIFQINAKENTFFRLLGAIEKIGVIADSKAEIFDFTFIDSDESRPAPGRYDRRLERISYFQPKSAFRPAHSSANERLRRKYKDNHSGRLHRIHERKRR